MGYATWQYSKEEIIEKYQRHIDNYENIVVELEMFENSLYVKEKNIGIYLNEHTSFCKEAVDVLKCAINQINNHTVDNLICMRLRRLFESCKDEHKKLEDTYRRVPYEQTEDFYTYEDIHKKLRTECDEMEYCDETIEFMKAMIIGGDSYINIFKRDVNNASFQQGTIDSMQIIDGVDNGKGMSTCIQIEKEKTSLKLIFKRELRDLIIGIILILAAMLVKKSMEFKGENYIHTVIYIGSFYIYVLLFVIAIAIIISFCSDLIYMIELRKNGRFVEFMSKKHCINLVFNIFREKENNDIIRPAGKCFKNDNGEIYQIKSMLCPYCESKPIGKMYLVKNTKEKKYIWRCLENPSHEIEFDYKQKF